MLSKLGATQTWDNSVISAERLAFIEKLIDRGGPEPAEYDAFTAWTDALANDVSNGRLAVDDVRSFWREVTQHAFKGTAQATTSPSNSSTR